MDVATIGLDLAKHWFQVHGIGAQGQVVMRGKLRRGEVVAFFAALRPCLVGMEACATAHHWSRELSALGHEVKLMPPAYVKTYLKHNKNDAADAEASCEEVTCPTMRFVPARPLASKPCLRCTEHRACSSVSVRCWSMRCGHTWRCSASSPRKVCATSRIGRLRSRASRADRPNWHAVLRHTRTRATYRKRDETLSAFYWPYHTHNSAKPLTPGAIYEVDIEIWPTCVVIPSRIQAGLDRSRARR